MCEKIPTLTLDQKICAEMETEAEESSHESTFYYQDLESVNKGLSREPPVIKVNYKVHAYYPKKKLTKIKAH